MFVIIHILFGSEEALFSAFLTPGNIWFHKGLPALNYCWELLLLNYFGNYVGEGI